MPRSISLYSHSDPSADNWMESIDWFLPQSLSQLRGPFDFDGNCWFHPSHSERGEATIIFGYTASKVINKVPNRQSNERVSPRIMTPFHLTGLKA